MGHYWGYLLPQQDDKRHSKLSSHGESNIYSATITLKVITNLKYWGGSEPIISKTLQLLSDLSVGYGTVRKLVKLEEVGFLLSHHTAGKENA